MEVCLPIISCKDTIFFRNISNFFQFTHFTFPFAPQFRHLSPPIALQNLECPGIIALSNAVDLSALSSLYPTL